MNETKSNHIRTVTKSDGSSVPFDPDRLNKWAQFANNYDLHWSEVALNAYKKCTDGCSTLDLHKAMIDSCVEMETHPHLKMAGRLLLGAIYKEAHGGYKSIPTLKEFYDKMVEANYWIAMDYTEEELAELEEAINHDLNLEYNYTTLSQMHNRYLIKDLHSKICHESPQFLFMGLAMANMENENKDIRLNEIKRLYKAMAELKINVATPMLVNLRTPSRGLASCNVYTVGDTAPSISVGNHIAEMMTCASAGIGSHMLIRSKGDPIRGGRVIHQGKLPYYKVTESVVHASKQACYDDKTEILTEQGFILFKDFVEKEGIKVAQVNNEKQMNYVLPNEVHEYDNEGDLVNFNIDGNNFLVTDNHEMVFKKKVVEETEDNYGYHRMEAKDITKEELKNAVFDTTAKYKGSIFSTTFEHYLRFITKVFSDVTMGEEETEYRFNKENKDLAFHVSEKLFPKLNKIFVEQQDDEFAIPAYEKLVGKTFIVDDEVVIMVKNKAHDHLLGFDKDLPELDTMQFLSILDYINGTSESSKVRSVAIPTKKMVLPSKLNADTLQEFLVRNGIGSKVVDNEVEIYGEVNYDGGAVETSLVSGYEGKVYCVTVPTNNIIVRREGFTLVCGNSRGGANTSFFSVLDPEIEDLIALKNPMTIQQKRIRNIDYAVQVNRLFVEKVARNEDWYTISYYYAPDLYDAFYSGDYDKFLEMHNKYEGHEKAVSYKARTLANKFLVESVETGRIYIHYADEMNRHTPFEETIYSSNLCIAGDQVVATDKGLFTAEELFDLNEELVTFDGKKKNKTSKMKLRERNVPTYKITLSNGMSHTVTDYHEIMTDRGLVACKDLIVGVDKAKINRKEGIFGKRSDMKDEAFLLGLYEGDGTQHTKPNGDKYIHIDLYSDKTMEIKDYVQEVYDRLHSKYMKDGYTIETTDGGEFNRHYEVSKFHERDHYDTYNKCRLSSRMLSSKLNFEKGVIPKWLRESDKETQIEYIKGLFYTDGTYSFYEKRKIHYLSLTSTNKELLEMVQTMLNNMGVTMGLYMSEPERETMMPDGKGGSKVYYCKETWRLVCGSTNDIVEFNNLTNFLEFRGKGDSIKNGFNKVKPRKFNKIVSIEYVSNQDVYCPTVYSDEHLFVSNCFITSNCMEIALTTKPFPSMEDLYKEDSEGEIGLCSLASIVVGRVSDEEYEDIAYLTVKMIDNTIDIMDYPFPSLKGTAQKRRSIGVGITNLAHLLASKGLSYSTKEGKEFMHEIAETHTYWLYRASLQLAKERGVAEWMSKSKYRNGWLPIDTYNKRVDELGDMKLKFDWEALRQEIIEVGGIRNSTLSALMPVESCVSRYTEIRTEDGIMSMEDIFELTGYDLEEEWKKLDKFTGGKWFDLVTPINVHTLDGNKEVDKIWLNGNSSYMEIELEDGTVVKATHHHKLLVRDEEYQSNWVMAMDIEEGDSIVSGDNSLSDSKVIRVTNMDENIVTLDIEVKDVHHYILSNGSVVHNSSQLTNTTNSVYPIRQLKVIKESNTGKNVFLAPDMEELGYKYDIAWRVDSKDLIDTYAIFQKFIDQAISADLYLTFEDNESISSSKLLKDFIYMSNMGCKTRYYINSAGGIASLGSLDSPQEEVFIENNVDDEDDCVACKL